MPAFGQQAPAFYAWGVITASNINKFLHDTIMTPEDWSIVC